MQDIQSFENLACHITDLEPKLNRLGLLFVHVLFPLAVEIPAAVGHHKFCSVLVLSKCETEQFRKACSFIVRQENSRQDFKLLLERLLVPCEVELLQDRLLSAMLHRLTAKNDGLFAQSMLLLYYERKEQIDIGSNILVLFVFNNFIVVIVRMIVFRIFV